MSCRIENASKTENRPLSCIYEQFGVRILYISFSFREYYLPEALTKKEDIEKAAKILIVLIPTYMMIMRLPQIEFSEVISGSFGGINLTFARI